MTLEEVFAISQIKNIVLLVMVDVVVGVIAALLKKEFVLGKVAGFLKRGVLKYVLGFAVLALVGASIPSLSWAVTVGYVLAILGLVGSILDNLGKLGLPIPKMLRK
ncbi:MAG: phage holin family protein [Candidatus Nealsonbacteria bacterium]|nr:phage holin family protein [Candidatus Nealsonbacteria bacterium]